MTTTTTNEVFYAGSQNSLWVDAEVAALLSETFAMIPRVAGQDMHMELWLRTREPMMLSYAKKLWIHLHATSRLDYCIKADRLYSSVITTMPASVLACQSQKELDALLTESISSLLQVSFTAEELEGKATLAVLGGSIQTILSPHITKLRSNPSA
ncbi:MAG: hypothetical protein MUP21_05250 [Dehalococcoidia bacterium]|nr:hypothetical protein [Dehalococcoidia bacterium]